MHRACHSALRLATKRKFFCVQGLAERDGSSTPWEYLNLPIRSDSPLSDRIGFIPSVLPAVLVRSKIPPHTRICVFVTASLTCVSGPLARSTLALDAELSFGRDPSNRVCLPEVSISRRHCVISQRDGAYFVRDLDSHNGTLVNGVRITEHQLEHGDHIKIGVSVFQFNISAADVPRTATVSFEDLPFASDDAASSPERLVASQLSNDRLVHDFG